MISALAWSALAQQTVSCGPGQVLGVAVSSSTTKSLSASLKFKGDLPEDGVWSFHIVQVIDAAGEDLGKESGGYWDVKASGTGGAASFQLGEPAPANVFLTGELIHYETTEEYAEFPAVDLVKVSEANSKGDKPMRLWTAPKNEQWETKTDLGLELQLAAIGGYGYSGVGWDDAASLWVCVDQETLDKGLATELASTGAKHVGRVDAVSQIGERQTLYCPEMDVTGSAFWFRDNSFSQRTALKLKVIRMIPDKRYSFALSLPVQVDKDIYSAPNSSPAAVWP